MGWMVCPVIKYKIYYMKKLLVFLAVLTPIVTLAHPGHGVAENNGLTHLLLSHGYLVGLGVIVLGLGYYFLRKFNKQ